MNERPLQAPSSDVVDAALGDLIAEITDRLQAGEAVAVEEYAARHPECAERLRQLMPALEEMARLGSSDSRESADGEPLRGTLGDFRIVREVGRRERGSHRHQL